jgi:RNA polymerase sigma-70 factor, ECF subfamily
VSLLYAASALRSAAEQRDVLGRVSLGGVDEDEQLVERCRGGDTRAFGELFRRHRSRVARLVQRLGTRPSEREDLLQEIFTQVHRSLRDFRGQSRFGTWLYRVAVNVVLMQRRAARSRPALVESPVWASPASDQLQPDEELARRLRVQAFQRLLERLSDKKRAVFVLHELEGLAPAEIGKIVGAPVLTVRTRLFYARRELAALLCEEPVLASLAAELGALGAEPRSARLPEREPIG